MHIRNGIVTGAFSIECASNRTYHTKQYPGHMTVLGVLFLPYGSIRLHPHRDHPMR